MSLLQPNPSSLAPSPTIVIKLGGAADVPHAQALEDVARLVQDGRRVVIVHGGSGETNRLAERVGHPARTLLSPSGHESRHTDPVTLELFVMATAMVNRRIVGELQAKGVNALGLSGLDGGLLRGQRKGAIRTVENGRVRIVRDDWSGSIEGVNGELLASLLGGGLVPVVAPVAMSPEGRSLNVDGDRVAAALAAAVGAEDLVLLTGAAGLYRSFPDPDSIVRHATTDQMDDMLQWAKGRMKRKVIAANAALTGGVGRVTIASAQEHAPVRCALDGQGTTLVQADHEEVTA